MTDKQNPSHSTHAERELIRAIVEERHPPGSALPNERELAARLGITRPTLREVLKRMERDGWISIRHGKSTLVRDFWSEGGLNVLSGIAESGRSLPPEFVDHLLEARTALAPRYACLAVERDAADAERFLRGRKDLSGDSGEYCRFDWDLHHLLARLSGNPVYVFIINGFRQLYLSLGREYFVHQSARSLSDTFYSRLEEAVLRSNADEARQVTLEAMRQSRDLWRMLQQGEPS